jgi:hypothetical protein
MFWGKASVFLSVPYFYGYAAQFDVVRFGKGLVKHLNVV